MFILANVLLGYVFPYVFLAGILSGLFMSGPAGKTAHFIGMSTMWLGYFIIHETSSKLVYFLNILELLVYILLVGLMNGIVIRLLKSDWVLLVMAAIFLFFLSAYLGAVIVID